ncbi:MAG: DUF4832 domain-containing protein [Alistipes sp.]|nr:DUF4832 domain-containing protein [Alistipes sp.]
MGKINRRQFLQRAGVSAAALVVGMYGRSNAAETAQSDTVREGISATVIDKGERYEALLADNGAALVNPMMGWVMYFYSNELENYGSKLAPSDTVDDFPGLSTVYLRVPWSFVEPEEGKFVWELLDTPAQRWIEKGKYVAFRISAMESWLYYATPKWVFDAGAVGYDVEGQYIEPEYDDKIFLEKVENFIKAFAARYDNNPNVAFVDVGHFGMWGEGHTVMTTPKHGHSWGVETQKRHIDIYLRHFQSTQLCISDDFAVYSNSASKFEITDYAFSKGVTLRDDSILVSPPPNAWGSSELAQKFWPTLPVILEHAHYNESYWDKDWLMKSVEDYHSSFMSIHWWPRILLEENRDVIERINRRMGYRFSVSNIEWPKSVARGEEFAIKSEWCNVGVAPCYRGGYPCFTLKDSKGGIVSTLVVDSFDVKSLQVAAPGKAKAVEVKQSFRVAPRYEDKAGVFFRACAAGEYDLYVSVGQRDGTPLYELPYYGSDGHKRYRIGKITVTD